MPPVFASDSIFFDNTSLFKKQKTTELFEEINSKHKSLVDSFKTGAKTVKVAVNAPKNIGNSSLFGKPVT